MRVGVIGLGKLGKIHARIYQKLPSSELKAICDINPEQKEKLPYLKNIPFYTHYPDLLKERVEAVSIATPTTTHFKIAKFFLERGVACLVEKPITSNLKEAQLLLQLAKKNKCFLLVGMVERFNPAYQKIRSLIKTPKFIEVHRLSPYPQRSLDISVILDLMIHDLDIILELVRSPIKKVEATATEVLSKKYDIANARLYFKNLCLANITSSRVSEERLRKIRIFLKSSYISLDFAEQKAKILKKINNRIKKEEIALPKEEPLRKEIECFLKNTKSKNPDYSHTQKAIASLALALKIEKTVKK
ncbi:MAG: Gfo/Idh/MocA family oxidoreductase [Candidatus Omnitrophica bacterium]|nr:Gfo/Idh/MocA family oxidoreductase [Candidatus Omnitrophota bacterium]